MKSRNVDGRIAIWEVSVLIVQAEKVQSQEFALRAVQAQESLDICELAVHYVLPKRVYRSEKLQFLMCS